MSKRKANIQVKDEHTITLFLKPPQREYLEETFPDATVKKITFRGYKWTPAYRLGVWDGKLDEVRFTNPQDKTLFLLRWK